MIVCFKYDGKESNNKTSKIKEEL